MGFYVEGETVLLLVGEVKTSSDLTTPPGVMSGGGGMAWQLEENAKRLDIQNALLKWLRSRCKEQPFRDLYKKAVKRYVDSKGKDLLLIGVLIRDTPPNELDLKARGVTLSDRLNDLRRVSLIAWYLPIRITDWVPLLQGVAP